MPIDTNLNKEPFFDDYSEVDNYHRILFRPAVPVQARELTQLQTILQNQIERFGDHMFVEGTIIKGCSFTFDQQFYYAKILDTTLEGLDVNLGAYANALVVEESSGLQARIIKTVPGFQTSPEGDCNTLYFKYLNAGTDNGADKKVFSNGAVSNTLTIYDVSRRIERVDVNEIGTNYSNTDVLTFGTVLSIANASGTFAVGEVVRQSNTNANGVVVFANSTVLSLKEVTGNTFVVGNSSYGTISGYTSGVTSVVANTSTPATGHPITYANGSIREIVLTGLGSGYLSSPYADIVLNANGQPTNGSGAVLQARHYIDQVRIAPSTLPNVGNPVGNGYAVSISDGIIYQKGHFVRVDPQSTIVSKYDLNPNNVVVGFSTKESVVNNAIDTSLNDNASGFTNYNAPGAFRLQLQAELVVKIPSDAAIDNNFLTLLEFQNGSIVRERQQTEYSTISREFARRTYEESGDYVVDKFPIHTESIAANSSHFNVVVGKGVGYVKGYRAELNNNLRIPVPTADTTRVLNELSITTAFGNYINVREFKGVFSLGSGSGPLTAVDLYDAAQNGISTDIGSIVLGGNKIGTAYVRGVEYVSGIPGTPSAEYRMFLFDVSMNSGKTFKDVRSLGLTSTAAADVVLTNGVAVLKDTSFASAIFPVGVSALKTFSNTENFTVRGVLPQTIPTTGFVTVSVGAGNTLPYTNGSTLTDGQKDELVLISTGSTSATRTGTVTIAAGGNTVTGSGTAFASQYAVGDYITVATGGTNIVTAVTNATSLSVLNNWGGSVSGAAHARAFPQFAPIPLVHDLHDPVVTVGGNSTSLTINLGETLAGSLGVTLLCNIKTTNGGFRRAKQVRKSQYVKIANTDLVGQSSWSLGLPDVIKINNVFLSVGSNPNTIGEDVTRHFTLDNGQRDTAYSLAKLLKQPTLNLSGTEHLIVSLDYFEHPAGGGYFTIDSYPTTTDAVPANNQIAWYEVPVYTSAVTGATVDLRDSIDTRISAANTVTANSTLSLASSVNQNAAVTFSSVSFPSPTNSFDADVTHFLPRNDIVVVDTQGMISVQQGVPSINPGIPSAPVNTFLLGRINVPAYPSLPQDIGVAMGRLDYTATVSAKQNRRYTMKDIESLETRVNQLEYYTLLSSLEQSTKDLVLPGEANTSISRFKNGFVVDPMVDYAIADVSPEQTEFKISIDPMLGIATPTFDQQIVGLKVANNANMSNSLTATKNRTAMLNYSDMLLFRQPIATKYRNVTESLWAFRGTAYISPSYDTGFSTTGQPMVISLDLASPVAQLASSLNNVLSYFPINQVSSTDVKTDIGRATTTSTANLGWFTQTTATTTTTTTKTATTTTSRDYLSVTPGATNSSTQNVGEFVTDVSFKPYMRGQAIAVFATGLRASTRHYFFFDEKDVNGFVCPAQLKAGALADHSLDLGDLIVTGPQSSAVYSNANGEIAAVFYLPNNTFLVGDRELVIADIDAYSSISSAVSTSRVTYSAYNFQSQKSNLSVDTTTLGQTNVNRQTVTSTTVNISVSNTVSQSVTTDWNWWDWWAQRGGGNNGDPLCQTFLIPTELARGGEGVFLSKTNLYFKRKDENRGLNIEIRTVEVGFPTQTVLASVRLPASSVNVSDNGQLATPIIFSSPVFLKAGQEYALVILPEGNSPDYLVWTGVKGETDVYDSSLTSKQDWNLGSMFTSSNGRTWVAYQGEDVKLDVYVAEFAATTGSVTLSGNQQEYLDVINTTGTGFVYGETVGCMAGNYVDYQFTTTSNSYDVYAPTGVESVVAAGQSLVLIRDSGDTTADGTVTTSIGSTTITGTGFSSTWVGQLVVIGNVIRRIASVESTTSLTVDKAIATAGSVSYHIITAADYRVAKVTSVSVAGGTVTVRLDQTVGFTSNADNKVYVTKCVTGKVEAVSLDQTLVRLSDSTASSSLSRFVSGGYLVGNITGTSAIVNNVQNINISYFDCLLNATSFPGTTLTASAQVMSPDGTYYTISNVRTNSRNYLPVECQLRSFSNELVATDAPNARSFLLTYTVTTNSSFVSPIVDVSSGSVLTYKYNINAASQIENEHLITGTAAAKYVAKKVVLANGLEAEDVKVFVSAYKPQETDVKVYAKILNESDSESFNQKNWSELAQITDASVFSTTGVTDDYRDFEFTFPTGPISTVLNARGVTQVGNTVVATTGSLVGTLVADDLVTVTSSIDGSKNTRIVTAVGATTVTFDRACTFADSAALISKADNPESAFKDFDGKDYGVVRYYNKDRAAYDGYKVLAIKVVVSSGTTTPRYTRVPFIDSIRAIACST